jgi:hypothetical protein
MCMKNACALVPFACVNWWFVIDAFIQHLGFGSIAPLQHKLGQLTTASCLESFLIPGELGSGFWFTLSSPQLCTPVQVCVNFGAHSESLDSAYFILYQNKWFSPLPWFICAAAFSYCLLLPSLCSSQDTNWTSSLEGTNLEGWQLRANWGFDQIVLHFILFLLNFVFDM